jgi:hypothetical protein
MALDDRMRRAAAELRGAVAGRRGEPIGAVRHRSRLQRGLAAVAGATVVLVGVGVGVLGARGVDRVELTPVAGEHPTTMVVDSTTTATAAPSPATSTAPPGDGLSEAGGSAVARWLQDMGPGAELLLAERGVALAAAPSASGWDLMIKEDSRFDALYRFGAVDPGGDRQWFIELAVDAADPMVTVFGTAPVGIADLRISFGAETSVEMEAVYRRETVGRAVFMGRIDPADLVANAPVDVQIWMVTTAESEIQVPRLEFTGGWVSAGYEGPITTELFAPPVPLVTDSITVDAFPDVYPCEGGRRADIAPNVGRVVDDGTAYRSPEAALEGILTGELSTLNFPHRGFVEMRDTSGNVAYGFPLEGDQRNFIMLIEVAPVADGWTVVSWEGSGC